MSTLKPVAEKNVSAPSLLVTTAQLASLLGCSRRHIERLESSGQLGIEPRYLGGKKMFLRLEAEEWVRAGMPDRANWRRMKEAHHGAK